ncbi:MAG: nickel pincer cofactor biosynthesis protein LarB [Firmicutes bacterium]|nr:nickel pincer cofactor biosynthesis protein LarB [Bacillota bacterium]
MEQYELKELLKQVADGTTGVEEAILKLKMKPFEDIDIASLDTHRGIRQGTSEVVYGAGKTAAQIQQIVTALWKGGQRTIMVTRMSEEKIEEYGRLTMEKPREERIPFSYDMESRICLIGEKLPPRREGYILVATGGTSDIPVAEEAAQTAEILGNRVERIYDVGVAGIHRLLAHTDKIMEARVIIAVAGMEGALASVIGGLASCPVIAVPTSVGYGTAFGGVTALLSMLNSCASGVSVVNIDNGFGAGYLANLIHNMEA